MRAPQTQEVVLERQITRADGTVEPKEVVSYYHRNPLKRLLAKARARRRGVRLGKVRAV